MSDTTRRPRASSLSRPAAGGANAPTVARPREPWRSHARPSVKFRPKPQTHDEAFAALIGLSVAQAHKIRVQAPHWIATLITHYRTSGAEDAIATVLAPIDAACTSRTLPDRRSAILAAVEAHAAAQVQLVRYLLAGGPELRRLLQLEARTRLRSEERDAVLGEERA